jgi:large subunit ribosomal protein MRP49
MKNRTNSDILEELVRVTNAYPVEPTPEDREEQRLLEEQRIRSLADSKLSQEVRAKQKRERDLLEQARGVMGSMDV